MEQQQETVEEQLEEEQQNVFFLTAAEHCDYLRLAESGCRLHAGELFFSGQYAIYDYVDFTVFLLVEPNQTLPTLRRKLFLSENCFTKIVVGLKKISGRKLFCQSFFSARILFPQEIFFCQNFFQQEFFSPEQLFLPDNLFLSELFCQNFTKKSRP